MDNPLSANVSDLITLMAVVVVAVSLRKLRWFTRIPLATLFGWPIVVVGVAAHWRLLMLSAATQADRAWVAAHDSGPLSFSLLFGWLLALVVVLIVELVLFALGITTRTLGNRSAA